MYFDGSLSYLSNISSGKIEVQWFKHIFSIPIELKKEIHFEPELKLKVLCELTRKFHHNPANK